VLLVSRALLNPALDQLPFLRLERRLVRVRRRHHLVLVRADDALPEFGLFEVARHQGTDALTLGRGSLESIQAELAFAVRLVRAVTGEAVVREDRPDVFVIGHRFGPDGGDRKEGA
jgi:hypothetical protein